MSVDTFVFLRDDRLPSVAQLQTALDEAGMGIVLDQIDDLRSHVGYIPATHQGQQSGFEWFYGPIADYFGGAPPDGLGDRGHVANFVTHSDMRELFCAMATGAVLAQISDGLALDEESGELINSSSALEVARDVESCVKN